jgi:hypothetical protein
MGDAVLLKGCIPLTRYAEYIMHIRVTIKQMHIDLQVRYRNSEFKIFSSLAYSSVISDSVIAVWERWLLGSQFWEFVVFV